MLIKEWKAEIKYWKNKAKNTKSPRWKSTFKFREKVARRELKLQRSFNSFKRFGKYDRHFIAGADIMGVFEPWTSGSLQEYWFWYVRNYFDGDEAAAKQFHYQFYHTFFKK